MSIATDVSRIKGNITAALAAIAEKGVTVPDGSTSDALASLIASIEAGSGGVELQYNRLYLAATGTFTPAERTEFTDSSPLVIDHNAGIIPFVVMVGSNGMAEVNDLDFIVTWRIPHWNASYYGNSRLYSVSSRRGSTSGSINTKHGIAYHPQLGKWDIKKVDVAQANISLFVNAGKTYTWRVYGIE